MFKLLQIITAATMAGAGLATDNASIILGAILVSPIGHTLKRLSQTPSWFDVATLLGYVVVCVAVGAASGVAMDPRTTVFDQNPDAEHGLALGHELESRGTSKRGAEYAIAALIGFMGGVMLNSRAQFTSAAGIGLSTCLLSPCVAAGMYLALSAYTHPARRELQGRAAVASGVFATHVAAVMVGCVVARLLAT